MKLNKLHITSVQRILIFTNSYGRSYSFISELVDIAKKDFPSLESDDIEIVVLGGDTNSSLMGIEFKVTGDNICDDYEQQEQAIVKKV